MGLKNMTPEALTLSSKELDEAIEAAVEELVKVYCQEIHEGTKIIKILTELVRNRFSRIASGDSIPPMRFREMVERVTKAHAAEGVNYAVIKVPFTYKPKYREKLVTSTKYFLQISW